MKKLLGHLGYSKVVSTLALFVALGGVAWAVEIAPNNSVVSESVKNNEVKPQDVAANAVGNAEVKDLHETDVSLTLSNGWVADGVAKRSKSNERSRARSSGNIDGSDSTGSRRSTCLRPCRPLDDAVFLAGCQSSGTAIISMSSFGRRRGNGRRHARRA